MNRLILIFICVLAWLLQARGQQFRYSDREFYTASARLPVVAAPGEQFHLWSFERYQTKLYAFDAHLRFLETTLIKTPIKAGFRVAFLKFHSFYYTVMSDSVSTKVFRISKDGLLSDQTTLVLDQLSSKDLRPYFFARGSSNIFLIQKMHNDPANNTVVHITVFDSGFNYRHKMAVNVPYLYDRPQIMQLTPVGEQLLLLGATMSQGEIAFTITRIDVVTGFLSTKVFHTENLEFLGHQIYETNEGFILESQVREYINGKRSDPFTYFMKLTGELDVTHTLFLTAEESNEFNTSGYLFLPKLTLTLPGKTLLNISLGRKKDRSAEGAAEIYRFVWLDSNFHIAKSFVQPSERGKFAPTLSVMNDKGFHLYYEEYIRPNVSLIHRYELKGAVVDDVLLLLKANYQYDLSRAVISGVSSFVMPYYRKNNIGLVRVKM